MQVKELNKLCREWQKVLRLTDWVIEVRRNNLLTSWARMTPSIRFKTAVISMRDPEWMNEGTVACRDEEVTLLHELLHIHGVNFDNLFVEKPAEHDAYEVMIELTAQALVWAKRGRQPRIQGAVTGE